ncbi:tol-pal system-associated acyl-CoA thioesterase [Ferrovum myxofaciens]|jgi:acyl-CoA thioester hydrolase|uniref:Acyl-CoA thioesterase YbgC n=2 Tax=root TaxID=1 RepID=A0A8F3DWW1_9PROT|nr:tol-pal system-associated acyl-CoA thioesterase [Ferrovum myxofaciens]NDU90969.1 tol-pal system-associated acyl-CoA thioesterase [Ferrovum sp.]KXW58223.1 acyl-CoA thioesterase YbgC [Ferrovum myxofaciens]MBU6995199.1 tol-pal system-associated acyl-CoA thioesterase [Ferrovum myxofaciens]QKE39018.1 MAG: tol-pal system-associated acyl-CoA thioesterase [Ferrovum myxofaciens]QWY74246.1 MAG: tol-pal system-associated acyl-CoA thioesterase [Ferrovum myxofaciens]
MNVRRIEVPLRIYHEDTDAGGVVYHANYLRYMERARTDWLYERGFDHERVAHEHGILFMVRSIEIKFQRPARLGDNLLAVAELAGVRHGLMTFRQSVMRGEQSLVRAQVVVACVTAKDFTVAVIPPTLANFLGVEG